LRKHFGQFCPLLIEFEECLRGEITLVLVRLDIERVAPEKPLAAALT
jgi:hypothetical protein